MNRTQVQTLKRLLALPLWHFSKQWTTYKNACIMTEIPVDHNWSSTQHWVWENHFFVTSRSQSQSQTYNLHGSVFRWYNTYHIYKRHPTEHALRKTTWQMSRSKTPGSCQKGQRLNMKNTNRLTCPPSLRREPLSARGVPTGDSKVLISQMIT